MARWVRLLTPRAISFQKNKAMKHILILPGFLFLALLGCKKEPPTTNGTNDPDIPYFDFKIYNSGNQENGSAKATTFDKEWNASAYVRRFPDSTSRYFEVYLETYSDEGSLRDQISFDAFEGKVGEYQVTRHHFDNRIDDFSIAVKYNFWISDGDLLYGNYFIDTTYSSINKVIIDKNDGDILQGRFSLVFTSNVVEHRDIPGRIYFKNGTFRVKL